MNNQIPQNNNNHIPVRLGLEMESGVRPDAAQGEQALKDILQVVRSRLWLILLMSLLGAGLVGGFSVLQTPTYEASIKILIGQEQESAPSVNLGSDVQGLRTAGLGSA